MGFFKDLLLGGTNESRAFFEEARREIANEPSLIDDKSKKRKKKTLLVNPRF